MRRTSQIDADLEMLHAPRTRPNNRSGMPDQEMLPTDPNAALSNNSGNNEGESGYGDLNGNIMSPTNVPPPPPHKFGSKWLLLEAIFVLIAMLTPMFINWLAYDYPEYSLPIVKGTTGLDNFREFDRWSYFLSLSYVILVASEVILRWLPNGIFKACKYFKVPLYRTGRTAIACLRYSSDYVGGALSLILIFNLAHWILFEPSIDASAHVIIERLKKADKSRASELLFGDQAESLLAAAFVMAVLIAVEKYLIAMVQASFHRLALAPRIAHCNAKFQVISALYRESPENLPTDRVEDGDAEQLAKDKGLDLSSTKRARQVARTIFKSICSPGETTITAADFKPYFTLGEHERAFKIFDVNSRKELDQSDFITALVGIYDERFRTAQALLANSRIVMKLDWILLTLFSIVGFLLSLVILNHKSYAWVTSMGTFVLGFSFLFQTTMAKILDTFLFVFVEHAYDVSDNVEVDKENLVAKEIQIFTTIFERDDGVLVYSPNASLKGKTIYNKRRMRSEVDTILFLISAHSPITSIAKIRTSLVDYLTEQCNEFTGVVTLNIVKFTGEGEGRKARIRLEAKYRPIEEELRSELALHDRRVMLREKLEEICQTLEVENIIEDADE